MSTSGLPQARRSRSAQESRARSGSGTTDTRPARIRSSCAAASPSRAAVASARNSARRAGVTRSARPPGKSSTSVPSVRHVVKVCWGKRASKWSAGMSRPSASRNWRARQQERSTERRSSSPSSRPAASRPASSAFHTGGGRSRFSRFRVRTATPSSWPAKWKAARSAGAVAEGRGTKRSRLSPTPAAALAHGTKSPSSADTRSAHTAERASL
mmetsp:Transcript_28085/g.58518  ORF Transcript_28085/g.58518 Transcript_28085/m.58518 type:complete len:213 (+) Transcript_28085:362-1000(+)